MARKLNWNPKSQHAELCAADIAITALLAAAEITSIKMNGKDVPASEAPLEDRIKAYGAISKPGAVTADMSELVTTNDNLSAENTRLEAENTRTKAALDGATQKLAQAQTDLQTTKNSLDTQTAQYSELAVRHEAAIRQVGEWTGKYNGLKSEISRRCLAEGCLTDLRNAKGELLPSTASAEEKQAAADLNKPEDNLKSLCDFNKGQVNQAMAKLGVDVSQIPAGGPTQTATAPTKQDFSHLKGLERAAAAHKAQQPAK